MFLFKRLILFYFLSCTLPVLLYGYYTYEPANAVVGQTAFTQNTANQGLGTANATTVNSPYSVFASTYQGKNLLIVADSLNNRVLIYSNFVSTTAAEADVVIGQTSITGTSANQGLANPTAQTLSGPECVFFDGTKLFIADRNNNRVLIYNTLPTAHNAAADIVIGQATMSGKTANPGGIKARTVSSPIGLFVKNGKLFIADAGNNRVLLFTTVPSTHNVPADIVIGQTLVTAGSINQGAGASAPGANTLYAPTDIYSDGTKIFIADQSNNRVLIYNQFPSTHNASADVVVGQTNFTSYLYNINGQTTPNINGLYWPTAVYCDGTRLFISEQKNHRMVVFDPIPTNANASASIVLGQNSFTAKNTLPVSSNTLNTPRDFTISNSKLFLADSTNNRVLVFRDIFAPPVITTTTPASVTNTKISTITITGTNFQDLATVTLSKTGQTTIGASSVIVSSSTITAIFNLIDKTTGFWSVTVTNPDNQSVTRSNAVTITLDPPPTITSITPSGALNTNRAELTVYGTGFKPTSSVKLTRTGLTDITPLSVQVIGSTVIIASCDLAGKTTGYWDIRVINPDTQFAVSANAFLIDTFLITEVLPAWWNNHSEVIMYIKGKNFLLGSDVSLYKLNEDPIVSKNTSISSDKTIITCAFNLKNSKPGLWDIRISTFSLTYSMPFSFLIYSEGKTTDKTNIATGSFSRPTQDIVIQVPTGSDAAGTQLIISSSSLPSNLNITIVITINIINNPPALPITKGTIGKVIDFSPGGLAFDKSVTIRLPYTASDLALYGETNPNNLQCLFYNDTTAAWENVPVTAVDTVNKLVEAQLSHFSYYTLALPLNAQNSALVIYPNPCKKSLSSTITFSDIAPGSSIKIFTIAGELVRTLADTIITGQVTWDLKNSSGDDVASGVYICIIDDGNSRSIKKLSIIK